MENARDIPENFFRPANDWARPMSTVELALNIRPTPIAVGSLPVWKLDSRYDRWAEAHFPADRLYYCPLKAYDQLVRPAAATHTIEELDAEMRQGVDGTSGYALRGRGRWNPRQEMFVVGSRRAKALLEFLFAFG